MNELNKEPTRHVLRSLLKFPLQHYQEQLNLLVPTQQQLQLHIKLKQNQSIGLKWLISTLVMQCDGKICRCSISIAEVSVESFAGTTFHVALVLNNTGLSSCSLSIALEQQQPKNSDVIAEEHFQQFHLSPMYQQLVYFTLSVRKKHMKRGRSFAIRMQAIVREASSNATVAERDFLLKHAHHCTCISRCQCRVSECRAMRMSRRSCVQCLEKTWIPTGLQLQCLRMSEEEIRRAGFSRSHEERLAALHSHQDDPILQLTNQQSRYTRKWFLFIAIFALSLRECHRYEPISRRYFVFFRCAAGFDCSLVLHAAAQTSEGN